MRKILSITLILFAIPLVHAVCPGGKKYDVTLTFDDGPHNTLTPIVLDILKEEKVKGTFFVLGNHFAGGKSKPANQAAYKILDRMKNEGHYIGSHTYDHIKHTDYSADEIKSNIMKPNSLLKAYLSPVLRLPYGDGSFTSSDPKKQQKNALVMKTLTNAGFEHVGWNIDTNDWDAKKRPTLLKSTLEQICSNKGGIILFHDIHKYTVDNLQSWIKAIKKEGHTFVGLEKFVPKVKGKLPAKSCEVVSDKKVDELNKDVKKIIKKIPN